MRLVAAILVSLVLVGCGQKGPLAMPDASTAEQSNG